MKTKWFIIVLLFSVSFVNAQNLYDVVYTMDKQIPSYLSVKDQRLTSLRINSKNNTDALKSILQLNNETKAMLVDTLTDVSGGFHESYIEYYKGIKVDGTRCNIHYDKDGVPTMINGNFRTVERIDTLARISVQEGFLQALRHAGVSIDTRSEYPKAEKVIYVKDDTAYLTYKYRVDAFDKDYHSWVYVDALNGKIIDTVRAISNISSSVTTFYSGQQTIECQYYNDVYRLRDYSRGNGIETYAYYLIAPSTNTFNGIDYTSTNSSWNNMSAYDRAALDVHWGIETTYDYYYNTFGRNSYDNHGARITSYVNYYGYSNGILNNIPNACWNDSCMLFGRHEQNAPMVSLDITAHELTHAFTQSTSALTNQAESGAINEGLSDVFATCVERYAKPNNGYNIWLCGEDIPNFDYRDMGNPTCKYYHGTGWIDTSNPTVYNDQGGVHTNSGVFNYWFYLLVNGGSGTNEGGYHYTVSPISIDDAIQICYLANAAFLTSNSKYIDARFSSLFAAQALGYDDNVINQINNAWDAVGVYINIAGSNMVYSDATYMVPSLPDSCSVNWTLSGYNAHNFIVESDIPETNQCTLTRKSRVDFTGPYNLTLSAQIVRNDTVIKTVSKELTAPYILGNIVPCGYNVYSVFPYVNNSTIEWDAQGTNITSPTDTLPSVQPEDPYAYVIANTEGRDIYGKLIATVKIGNNVIGTLEKVLDMSGLFSGIWWQDASATDTTNVSPKSFPHLPWLEIVPQRKVYLQSEDFIDADITKTATGMFPAGWQNNNGVISFTPIMAVNSNVGTITINGTYPNSCRHFSVRLRAFGELEVNPLLLTVNPSGQTYTFSLNLNKDLDSSSSNTALPEEWRMEIVRSENGMKVFDSKISGSSKVIDTSGWKPGVYIAVAQTGKETLTVKFVVENRCI